MYHIKKCQIIFFNNINDEKAQYFDRNISISKLKIIHMRKKFY